MSRREVVEREQFHPPVVRRRAVNTVRCASCGREFAWSGMIVSYHHEVWCAWCLSAEEAAEEGLPIPIATSESGD